MKTRFNNRELCHIWAQQTQEIGKGSSMFFEGNKIYSYGKHFEIARIVKPNNGYGRVILFNSDSYSVTTSKHQTFVRQAIDYNTSKVYIVPIIADMDAPYTLAGNIPYFIEQIETNLKEAASSRKYKENCLSRAQKCINEMFEFAGEFGIQMTSEMTKYFGMNVLSPEVMAEIQESEKLRKARELQKRKKDIEEWLTGEKQSIGGLSEVFLRVNGENVETTLGAKVPIIEANLLYKAIKTDKPVHGIKIGYYTVNGYNNGVLAIGCHKLKDTEINRFAKVMGW